jgi:hypothetical protein
MLLPARDWAFKPGVYVCGHTPPRVAVLSTVKSLNQM